MVEDPAARTWSSPVVQRKLAWTPRRRMEDASCRCFSKQTCALALSCLETFLRPVGARLSNSELSSLPGLPENPDS